jgi:anti-anti-sigma factor
VDALASFAVTVDPNTRTVCMAGEFDARAWALVSSVADSVPVTGAVTVDAQAVTFIDAGTLGRLVSMKNRARAAGTDLTVVSPSPRIRRVFVLTGLHDLLARQMR